MMMQQHDNVAAMPTYAACRPFPSHHPKTKVAHSYINLLPDALLGMRHFQTEQKKRNHKGKVPRLRVRN